MKQVFEHHLPQNSYRHIDLRFLHQLGHILLVAIIWLWGWNAWAVSVFHAPSIHFSQAFILVLMLITLQRRKGKNS